MVPAAIAAYVISPVDDLIPDALIGIGQVDDLTLMLMAIPLVAAFMRRFASAEIVNDYVKTLSFHEVVAHQAAIRNLVETGTLFRQLRGPDRR